MKNKKKLLIIIGCIVLGIIGIVVGILVFKNNFSKPREDEIYQENKRNYIDTVGAIQHYGFDDVISCGKGKYYITLNDNSYKLYDNDFNDLGDFDKELYGIYTRCDAYGDYIYLGNHLYSVESSTYIDTDIDKDKITYLRNLDTGKYNAVVSGSKIKIYDNNLEEITTLTKEFKNTAVIKNNKIFSEDGVYDLNTGEKILEYQEYYVNGKFYYVYDNDTYEVYNNKYIGSFKELNKENDIMVFSNEDTKYYVSDDGTEYRSLDIPKINEYYYLKKDDCSKGYKVYYKKDVINDKCSSYNIDYIDKGYYIDKESNEIFYTNDEVKRLTGNRLFVANDDLVDVIVTEDEGKKKYFDVDKQEEITVCGNNELVYYKPDSDNVICQVKGEYSNTYELKDKKGEVVGEYPIIDCYSDNTCMVKDYRNYGVINNKNEFILPFEKKTIIRNDNGYYVYGKYGNYIVKIGTNQDSYEDSSDIDKFNKSVDIAKVIKDYGLDNIKSKIESNKELFNMYAYYILHNNEIDGYQKYFLNLFSIYADYKDNINEDKIAAMAKGTRINKVNKDVGPIGQAGDASEWRVNFYGQFYKDEHIIYHELTHLVDFTYDKELGKGVVCEDGSLYKWLGDASDSSKCIILNSMTFITEGGAEIFSSKYFGNGIPSTYESYTTTYNILYRLFGEDTINKIFLADKPAYALYDLLVNKNGMSAKDFIKFYKTLDKVKGFDYKDRQSVRRALENLVSLVKKDYKNDLYLVHLLNRIYGEYGPGVLDDVYKDKINALVDDDLKGNIIWHTYYFTYENSKTYLNVYAYKNNKTYMLKLEYDADTNDLSNLTVTVKD